MTGGAQIVYLPEGLELLITGADGYLKLERYRWRIRRANIITGASSPRQPSDGLRAGRFRTIEDLIDALRREIAHRSS
jgi:hypothetical protein